MPVIESFQTMSDSGGIRHQIGSGARAKERNRTLDWEGINSESLRKLKRARGNKKGLITKAQDEIRDLMTDLSNTSLIKDRLLLLNTLLQLTPLITIVWKTSAILTNQMNIITQLSRQRYNL